MTYTATMASPEVAAKAIAISATVSAQALRSAVTTIHRNCERGTWHASPILGCIILRMKKGKMTVAKYGIDLQIST
ncbi:hypothetical protein ACQKHB_23050, partial [Escherichia coli]|uniref:hypothetical protein n=1 Tax=Escherichia coli TaxID=562 RepID=UPI003D085982